MRSLKTPFFISAVISISAISAFTQAPAAAQPGAAKIGLVISDRFSDQKQGITKLTAALRSVETEFKPRQDELSGLISRFDQLRRELNVAPTAANRQSLAQKAEQAESLQVEIKRKQEDARTAYARRLAALTDPIRVSIFNALTAYAKQRGLDVLIDGSKFPDGVYLLNPAADITPAFIRDYNSKNP